MTLRGDIMDFKVIDIIKYYFKNLLANFIVFLIVFLLGLIYIFAIYENKYVADTTFMIGACFHECEQDAHLNVDFNKKILLDYIELIKSNRLLEKANDYANLNYSVNELKEMVDVTYEEETEYVRIRVISANKKHSAKIAYNLFNILGGEIERVFDVNNIHLVDSDLVGHLKTSKSKLIILNILIAFIVTVIKTIIEFLFFPNKKISFKKIFKIKRKKKNGKKTTDKKVTTPKKKNPKKVATKKSTLKK